MEILDLDTLRPEARLVKLGGKDIDVSFIPCGITFDLDEVIQEIVGLDQAKVASDKATMKRAFDLGVKLCAIFCTVEYPELDETWIKKHASNQQVEAFAGAIKAALVKSYEGVEAHAKN